jgi:excisionase family DNA binding protein
MNEQAFFTVGEAAKRVGKSKATISNAIKSGKLSVYEKTESGYRIAASELFRVFTAERSVSANFEQIRTPNLTPAEREEMEGLRRENALLRDERNDLRRRLDGETEERRKLTAILTDDRQPQPGLWSRLFKRH